MEISESCDSTIKLAEFCSWRGVVPLTLPSLLLSPPAPPRAACLRSFPPFRGYLRFDSPYLPRHPRLHRPFSPVFSSPRPGTPKTTAPPVSVKDSRTARAATDLAASHLLLVAAVSGDGAELDISPIQLAKSTEVFHID